MIKQRDALQVLVSQSDQTLDVSSCLDISTDVLMYHLSTVSPRLLIPTPSIQRTPTSTPIRLKPSISDSSPFNTPSTPLGFNISTLDPAELKNSNDSLQKTVNELKSNFSTYYNEKQKDHRCVM